jgi:hypothetical protein
MARTTKQKTTTVTAPHWTVTANYMNADGFQDRVRARNARYFPELFPGITPSDIPSFPTVEDVGRFSETSDLALFPPGMVEEWRSRQFPEAAGLVAPNSPESPTPAPEPKHPAPFNPHELYYFNDPSLWALGEWLNDWWDHDSECWGVYYSEDSSFTLPFTLELPWEYAADAAIWLAEDGWENLVVWRNNKLFATVVRDRKKMTNKVHHYQRLKPSE